MMAVPPVAFAFVVGTLVLSQATAAPAAVPAGGIVAAGMRLRLALALSLLAAPSQSGLEVTLRDSRVVVRAVGAPLADVLTRFAQATGAEIVYEGARPRQLVTVVIEAGSPAEAVAQLLEGQGLNYALRLDPTGKNVEMLVITGSTSPPATAGATRTPRSSPPAFRAPVEEEAEPGGADEPFAPDAAAGLDPSSLPGTPPDDTANPAVGAPWPVAPGVPPGQQPSHPEAPSGSPAPQPGQPQPPAPASYPGAVPTGPPLPTPPVYPGPASYPPGGD